MEWIKVKVKHIEYEMSNSPDNVFKAWIMVMSYVAATEKTPTREQLYNRLGEKNILDLEKWLIESHTGLDTVINKVLEDVVHIQTRRRHNKDYYQASERRPKGVFQVGKIREDKIREDSGFQPTQKPHNDPKLAEIIHKTVKEMK